MGVTAFHGLPAAQEIDPGAFALGLRLRQALLARTPLRLRRFPLLDTHLEVARIEVCKQLTALNGLVVHDVHGEDRAIDLRTDGYDIADNISIIRRLMRAVVLPELPAIGGCHPEEHYQETREHIPGAPGLASRSACHGSPTGRGVLVAHEGVRQQRPPGRAHHT